MQVLPALDAGGVERTAVDVAAAVVAAGGLSVIASAGGRLEPEAAARGVDLRILPLASKAPLTIWRNADLLARIIRELNIGIVHARSRAPAWSAWLAARRTGAHFLTTYAGIYNRGLPGKTLYNGIMARGEVVIANSQFTADHVRRVHRVPPDRLVVIPRGIDLDVFSPAAVAPEAAAEWRARRGIPPNHRLILVPGRLTRWKGQAVAVAAVARLAAAGVPDLAVALAGDAQGRDRYVADLMEQIAAAGLDTIVRVTGHVTDMATAYAAADVVVSPSTEPEAFGRVPVEAMAMGRICIASDLGAPRETMRSGETGFLVPPGDAQALADALRRVLDMSPQARAVLGERARAHAASRFSVRAMCAATLEVYRRVAPNG